MKRVARILALSSVLLAGPTTATGVYQLQLLEDLYGVLALCAPVDSHYASLRNSVSDQLRLEGYTNAQMALITNRDMSGAPTSAECATLAQVLISAYLATPE